VAEIGDSVGVRVFISYARQDRQFATWLQQKLEESGIEVFRDIEDTLPGEEWWRRLTELIALADTIIFVLSPRSVTSKVCADEVAYARSLNKRIFPVVMEDVEWHMVPDGLAKIHSLYFARREEFGNSLARLIDALAADISWIREHTRLLDRARAWDVRGRAVSELLTGKSLSDAEEWLTARPGSAEAPTNLHQDYIKASRDAERVEQQRRLQESEEHRIEVQRQRDRAERALESATGTANKLVFGLANKLRDAKGVGVDVIRDILDQARELQRELIESGEKSSAVRRSEAGGLLEMSRVLLLQGDTRGALEASEQAHRIVSELSSAESEDAGLQIALSASHENLGNALTAAGRHREALSAYQRSVEMLERLRAGKPTDKKSSQRDLMLGHERIADSLLANGRKDEALVSYNRSLAMCEALVVDNPTNTELEHELSVIMEKIGQVLTSAGSHEEATSNYNRVMAIRRELATTQPGNTRWRHSLAAAHLNLGNGYIHRGLYRDGLTSYQQGLSILRELAAMDQGNLRWQFDLSCAQERIGNALLATKQHDAALTAYRQSLAIREALVNRDPANREWTENFVLIQGKLGFALSKSGRDEDARRTYAKALDVAEKAAASNPSNRKLRLWQAELHLRLGKIGERPIQQYKWIIDHLQSERDITPEEEKVLSEAKHYLAQSAE
jgi:tetratricopeptide (TPR) repeat protein